MLKYKVVTAPEESRFETAVNELLIKGWELFGNASMIVDHYTIKTFMQTMVKRGLE